MAIRKIVARSIGVDVIVAEDIAANAITAAEISSNAVTTAKINDGAVTTAKIADANVTTGKLATDLVVTHGLGSASTPSITFTGDTNTGIFSPTADTIAFAEGGAEIARFDSSGNLFIGKTSDSDAAQGLSLYPSGSISYNDNNAGTRTAISYRRSGTQVGAITTTTSGVTLTGTNGITFTATQSASADANTLDDYEEGTWTPVVTFSATAATLDSIQTTYRKIGGFVFCAWNFRITNKGAGSGNIGIAGFPFSMTGGTSYGFGNAQADTLALPTGAGSIMPFLSGTSTRLLYQTNTAHTDINNTHVNTNCSMYGFVVYTAA
jgi:hypothetical protein